MGLAPQSVSSCRSRRKRSTRPGVVDSLREDVSGKTISYSRLASLSGPQSSRELKAENRNGVLATGNWLLVCFPQMWGTSRWTAGLLSLVMLVPALTPVALACAAAPQAMHCLRHPTQPAMHCHHGMAKTPESADASFHTLDGCCQNHDCCRGLKTLEWARPVSSPSCCLSFLIERAPASQTAVHTPSDLFGPDSARAPPCNHAS
jgi:hypothetical protein